MKKLTAFLLVSFLAAASMRADVIFQDLFTYGNGPIIVNSITGPGTNSVWIRHSGSAAPSDAIINNNRLENSATGGSPVSRQDDVHRNFPAAYTNSAIPVYASFIVNATNLPNAPGVYFAHFSTNSSAFFGRIFALVGTNLCEPNTYRLGIGNAGTPSGNYIYPVDLKTNVNYQVVEEWDPEFTGKAYLWVNPVSSSDTYVRGSDAVNAAQVCPIQAYAFRQGSSGGNWFCTISNLVVATTFNEAATNCLSTNAVAPTMLIQPAAVTSNFVDSAFSLQALATGQGLGSLTYDWQQSATPDNASPQDYFNPNGNSSVLGFPDAQTTDTGYFTMIATTPYGLSVTSAVAKVVITAAPIPPAFITEPVSLTVYSGNSVVLSTLVSSPGNIYYTWYSNNVVVTAGEVDNGSSSTYEIDNLTPANSATYKVAVTNDVVANGIVSTNAVLTVSNAPAVTVAYLRQLIDPNTFVETPPIGQPFQVTGIVTSFTNLTTGNTANYYLQDATAGIDIFASFGSTFRPLQGNVVTFIGILSTFNANTGGLELDGDTVDYPYTSYSVVSNNAVFPLPAARIIPFTVTNDYGNLYVNTNIMGSRVALTNVYFGARAGTTISTTADDVVTVTNASGLTFALEFYDLDQDTTNQTLPAFAYSVAGNLVGATPSLVLAVSKFSDIVTNPPPAPPTIIPTNSPHISGITITAGGNVVISGTNAQATGVYYLLESTNMALPLSLWKPVATNVVGTTNNFTFTGTNVVTPGGQQQFYILSNTNSNHP